MGRDKALVEIDGMAMVRRVADTLGGAGCRPVTVVGGDPAALEALGLQVRPDRWPGEGPLGAIVTALAGATTPTVVVACDLPWLDAATVRALVEAIGSADVVVARTDRLEPLCACWSPSALPVLERRFGAGERAVHRVLDDLTVTAVDVDPSALRNVNAPGDLPGERPTG
jgi:molybdopterin-guanine dinucleotide biosynthesis protein A